MDASVLKALSTILDEKLFEEVLNLDEIKIPAELSIVDGTKCLVLQRKSSSIDMSLFIELVSGL